MASRGGTRTLTGVNKNEKNRGCLFIGEPSVASGGTLTGGNTNSQNRGCMFVYWRRDGSERDQCETVLGVDNAKSGICYIYICRYVCMDCTYAL